MYLYCFSTSSPGSGTIHGCVARTEFEKKALQYSHLARVEATQR